MCCRSEWQERMYIYKWHEVDQTKHEIFCVHIVCNEIQVKVNLEITTFFFYLRFPYCPSFFWFGVVKTLNIILNTLLPAVMLVFCCCIVVRAGEIDVFVWVSFWLEELPIWWAFDQIKCLLYSCILLSQIWNKNIKYDVKYTLTCSDVGVLLLYSGACGWDWCVCLSLFLIRRAPYMMSIWSNQMFIVYFYHRYEIKTLNMMYNSLLPAVMFCCCIVVRAGEIGVFVWVSFWLEELPIWWVFDQIKCLSYTFSHLYKKKHIKVPLLGIFENNLSCSV